MLITLFAYVLLGLLLARPALRLLLWLAARSGLYQPRWHYLRPYVAPASATPPDAAAATATQDHNA
jgi:Sec-independent protein secretion pathway component TatC